MKNVKILQSTMQDKLEELRLAHAADYPNIEVYCDSHKSFRAAGYILRDIDDVDEESGEVNRYKSLIVRDSEGDAFKTSSEPFIRTFLEIASDLAAFDIPLESVEIAIFKGESIQFKGKHYYHAFLH